MDFFTAMRTLLLSLSPVTAIVGSGTSARVWNSWQRTYTAPCVIIDIDAERPQNDLAGRSGMTIADVTLTCRGNTHAESDDVANAVKAIAGYGGTFDFVLDEIVHAEVPKGDGTTGHWYDHVMSGTAMWSEAIP